MANTEPVTLQIRDTSPLRAGGVFARVRGGDKFLLLLIFLIMVACNPLIAKQPTGVPIAGPSFMPEPTNTIFVSTPKPETTSTVLPTSTVVITSLPTYTINESVGFFDRLVKNNGGCSFPCVWGIDPAEGLDQPSMESFTRIVDIDSDGEILVALYDDLLPDSQKAFSLILWEETVRNSFYVNISQQEVGSTITLYADVFEEHGEGVDLELTNVEGGVETSPYLQPYRLIHILEQFGEPNQIFLLASWEDERPWQLPFGVLLFYEKQGFMIGYSMHQKSTETQHIGCPNEAYSFDVVSWPNSEPWTLAQIMQNLSGPVFNPVFADSFIPIQEVTHLSVQDFVQIYLKPGATDCLSTPKNFWLP